MSLIVSKPNVRGGRPCILGTGVRVTDVVMATLFHNRTPGEIASDYDVSLASVYAALAYYYEHKPELDDDIRQQIKVARELKEKNVGNDRPSLLPR